MRIDTTGMTAEKVVEEIKRICLDARKKDRDVVIVAINGPVITLEERSRGRNV